jgi:hypothetical protein
VTPFVRLGLTTLLIIVADGSAVLGQNLPVHTDGSLHQREIAIRLEAGRVILSVIPLSESIIRLLTPETSRALRGTLARFAGEIETASTERGALSPTVFLVAATGMENDVPFYPDQLAVTSRSLLRRPLAILPLSPQWNVERLSDRETVSALYIFDGVAVWEPLLVHYEAATTSEWERSLRVLERERNRVPPSGAQGGSGWYLSSTPANDGVRPHPPSARRLLTRNR